MKIVKIIILSLMFSSINAKNISFSVIDNSIHLSGDTLYFDVKLVNNTSNTYAFYNINSATIDSLDYSSYNENKRNFKGVRVIPDLGIVIKDTLGRKYISSNFDSVICVGFNPAESFENFSTRVTKKDKNSLNFDTYNIVSPNDSATYEIEIILSQLDLKTSRYGLQLNYISNNYYSSEFRKEKKRYPRLKNVVMFKGVLKSDFHWFNYKSDLINRRLSH